MPVIEFEERGGPSWSVVSEVASEVGHFATVFTTLNSRNDSPADVVLEEAPRTVGPAPIGVNSQGYWFRLG